MSCTPVGGASTIVTNPVVVFEVLSESTSKTDRTTKLIEYCSLPSVQHYALLEQDQAFATVINRAGDGWNIEALDAAGTLAMPEIGVEVPMAELYDGLDLTTPPGEEQQPNPPPPSPRCCPRSPPPG